MFSRGSLTKPSFATVTGRHLVLPPNITKDPHCQRCWETCKKGEPNEHHPYKPLPPHVRKKDREIVWRSFHFDQNTYFKTNICVLWKMCPEFYLILILKKTAQFYNSGQISIIPKPEFFGDFGDTSLTKPQFHVTSAGWSQKTSFEASKIHPKGSYASTLSSGKSPYQGWLDLVVLGSFPPFFRAFFFISM